MRRTLAALTVLLVLVLPVPHAAATDGPTRVFGSERIGTALAVLKAHPAPAPDVLLATAASFPDALSAGALAAELDAPLLLTPSDHLPDRVLTDLLDKGAERVWLLGGREAISDSVGERLEGEGLTVERIDGENRYETARSIALEVGPAASREVVLALGEHAEPERAWPDAVAAGAFAALPEPLPVLLTRPDEVPDPTQRALRELRTAKVLIVGGPAAVSTAVEEDLTTQGYEVTRIAGPSRYGTSVAMARAALARAGDEPLPVVFASGGDFPDALSAGALAARLGGPLLLVDPDELPVDADELVRERGWTSTVLVGGTSAADDWVVEQIRAALNGQPRPERARTTSEAEAEPEPERIEGWASWYGADFSGRPTASGEPFDHNALTAAHRELPFGTRLLVTNTANGAQVEVRINDRGPWHSDRILDLSERAAMELGYRDQGKAWVVAEILED